MKTNRAKRNPERRSSFTLLEIIVVITVLTLASSLAVATFRGESPARQMENAALQFESFCAKVRFNAMENGEDRIVLFNPDSQQFLSRIPDEFLPDDAAEQAAAEETKSFLPKWKLPENFNLERNRFDPSEISEDGTIEMFRFFPDGGASGRRSLELKYKNLRRTFDISPLTGLLTSTEEEVN